MVKFSENLGSHRNQNLSHICKVSCRTVWRLASGRSQVQIPLWTLGKSLFTCNYKPVLQRVNFDTV